jgi:DNA-binding XRE family transcriptional regulator
VVSMLSRYDKYRPGRYGLPHMGDVFADYRVRAGWTSQEIFAKVCGVDKQNVAYWESVDYLADMDRRVFLCKLLKISPGLLGLNWRSLLTDDEALHYLKDAEFEAELLSANSYGLYEDILNFSQTNRGNGESQESAYRFFKHQQELEKIMENSSMVEKKSWKDLLSRFYQRSTFIAQEHNCNELAISYANKALDSANSLDDLELISASLYRRARIHLIQNENGKAKEDIQLALTSVEKVPISLRGNIYMLAAEIHSIYACEDEKLKAQCRAWQDRALSFIYKDQVEDDGTFLWLDLYAVHHERAKTQTRFAFPYANDDELLKRLKDTKSRVDNKLVIEATDSLTSAKKHFGLSVPKREMDISISEARLLLVSGDIKNAGKSAKRALICARTAKSLIGVEEVTKLYKCLTILEPKNPYVCNLGVELGIY